MTRTCVGLSAKIDTGAASRPIPFRLRNALLGTVAAGALSLAFGGPALAGPDTCTIDLTGTTETCTGDQSAGISVVNPATLTTLNVNNLNQAIAPTANNTPGIDFLSAGAVTITSDTGALGIATTGDTSDGIAAQSTGSRAVTVTSTGNISTTGNYSNGIDAQSAGGGPVTVTSTGNISATGSHAYGIVAKSGTGAVTVTSTGNISTQGFYAAGIYVLHSGTGAVTVTSTGNLSTAGYLAYGIGVKNYGSGAVTVNSAGDITTTGPSGHGIHAYSSGAGAITVTSTGNITTTGGGAYGIYVKGGGTVAVTSTGNLAPIGNDSHGIYAIVTGGAGAVTVTSTGNIAAQGSFSYGIFADDRGTGATTVTSIGNIATTGQHGIGISAQGAAAVTVTSTGNITTAGDDASGIVANSRGSRAVTVTSTGNISTTGNYSNGIDAQSAGGGPVTVTSTGNISATGSHAYGIVAKSGTGAVTVTSTGNISTQGFYGAGIYVLHSGTGAVTVTSTGNLSTAGYLAYGIGVKNYGSGAVTVNSVGDITTTGPSGHGIHAYSSGAGAITVTSTGNITTTGGGAYGIYVKGGGTVAVTSTGNLAPTGDYSHGIYAIVTGGAGAVTVTSTGNIAAQGSFSYGIFVDDRGTGAVTVNSVGDIITTGQHGIGISAQGAAAVTVTSTGNITTTGDDASAIVAKSVSGPITVTINSGTVSGGGASGAGVFVSGGTTNMLTNMGTLMALSGLAIEGNTGNNTVNNFGTVIGNVMLGTGANAFNNVAGGFFNAGVSVNLGAGNVLINAGTLSPGGASVIQTTALTGNLVQSATGRLLTDVNIAGNSADRINVSSTARLAGTVQLLVQNVVAGPWQETIVSAAGGATNDGLSLLASPVLQAQLVFPNATDVVIKSAGLDFAVPGLNANQTALGDAFNRAAPTAGLNGPILSLLLNVSSASAYSLALNQLSGENATGSQQTTFDAMSNFMGVMTDPFIAERGDRFSTSGGAPNDYGSTQTGRAARDAYAMFTKAPLAQSHDPRWSVWAAGFGGAQSTDGNAATGSSNATSSIAGTAVGADYRFSPFTIAGFALAGGGTSFSVANGGGRSDLFQAGAFIRHDAGAAYISGALAYGWQDIITNRTVTLAGTDMLHAEFNANAFSGRIEGGYRFVAPWVGGIGITPYAAAQFTTFDLPAYAEAALAGSNAFVLSYSAKSITDPRSELGFRADKSFAMVDGVFTLRGRLAWAHDYDTDRAIGATFQSLPGASFVVTGAMQASDSALVTASLEKRWLNGWSAAGTFEGEFSDVTRSYAGKGVIRYAW